MKTPDQLHAILTSLIGGWEGECVEFKEGGEGFSTSEIGKYFSALRSCLKTPVRAACPPEAAGRMPAPQWPGHSARSLSRRFLVIFRRPLSNEANLRARSSAWLVSGVRNSTRKIVGTTYRPDMECLHGLKQQIADGCEPSTTFREIHELLPDDESLLNLRKQGLIEGRRPNLHVTAEIAAATDSEADYLHHRAFDDRYFCDLIVDYLRTFGSAKRPKFNRFLESKVSDLLTPAQKRGKIDRLLKRLQSEGKIRLNGYGKGGIWTPNPPSFDGPETHKNA